MLGLWSVKTHLPVVAAFFGRFRRSGDDRVRQPGQVGLVVDHHLETIVLFEHVLAEPDRQHGQLAN